MSPNYLYLVQSLNIKEFYMILLKNTMWKRKRGSPGFIPKITSMVTPNKLISFLLAEIILLKSKRNKSPLSTLNITPDANCYRKNRYLDWGGSMHD